MPMACQYWIKVVFLFLFFLAGTTHCPDNATSNRIKPTQTQIVPFKDFDTEVSEYKAAMRYTSKALSKKFNFSFSVAAVTMMFIAACCLMIVMLIFGAYVIIRN